MAFVFDSGFRYKTIDVRLKYIPPIYTHVNFYIVDGPGDLSGAGFLETIEFVVVFVPLYGVQFFVILQYILALQFCLFIPVDVFWDD